MSRRQARLDRETAAMLSAMAFIEIRSLAGRARRGTTDRTPEETLDRIRFLADIAHNLPGLTRPSRRRPSRRGSPLSGHEQAIADRPMSWTWHTAGPEGRAWMLRHIRPDSGWTPPPPRPAPRTSAAPLSLSQRAAVILGRWPVKTPAGREPLPPQARVLKTLDTAAVCALHEEAGRLRLGLGKGGPWLPAHLDPDGGHYLVPDPASYYWPGSPNATARRRQIHLVQRARTTERDTGSWGRDHKAVCDPQLCGYTPTASD